MKATQSTTRGFSIIELMMVVAVVAILALVGYPSYKAFIVRASREAAESQLLELANLQEKIFLASNSYTAVSNAYDPIVNVKTAYNGQKTGGLGVTSGLTEDGKYTITLPTLTATTFTLQAAPVSGKMQDGDGNITIDHTGKRLWGSASW